MYYFRYFPISYWNKAHRWTLSCAVELLSWDFILVYENVINSCVLFQIFSYFLLKQGTSLNALLCCGVIVLGFYLGVWKCNKLMCTISDIFLFPTETRHIVERSAVLWSYRPGILSRCRPGRSCRSVSSLMNWLNCNCCNRAASYPDFVCFSKSRWTKSTLHSCEVQTEISVSRVTLWSLGRVSWCRSVTRETEISVCTE